MIPVSALMIRIVVPTFSLPVSIYGRCTIGPNHSRVYGLAADAEREAQSGLLGPNQKITGPEPCGMIRVKKSRLAA